MHANKDDAKEMHSEDVLAQKIQTQENTHAKQKIRKL